MAEELQHLLRRINDDYLQKAEAEKEERIAQARAEAERIVAEAQKQAAEMIAKAEKEADGFRRRAEAAAGQAARDVALSLRGELEKRLRKAVILAAGKALTPEFMTGLIRDMAAAFAADPNAEMTVLSSRRDAEALKTMLKATLGESFKTEPSVFPAADIKNGMQISFRGDDVYFDFTDAAVSEMLSQYLGAELGKLLNNGQA